MTIDPQGLSSAHLIVEYGDYECSYSSQAYRWIQQDRHGGQVGFAWRQFPLTDVTRMRWLPHSPRDCQDLWIEIF